ncbi:MAG TPA: DUF1697 domain-containing protein [Gemmatimonadales bacterium]
MIAFSPTTGVKGIFWRMPQYVAFLRAVNVGGHAVVKMTALRDAFVSAGCKDVRTFIASGNVVFGVPGKTAPALVEKVHGKLRRLLGKEPDVAYRTVQELERLVARAPFKGHEDERGIKLYVAFLSRKPRTRPRFPLEEPKEALEAIGIAGCDVFIVSRPKKNGFYGFPNNFIEEELGVAATTRNWSTVTKILAFAK